MQGLEKKYFIKKERLNASFYFQSVLMELVRLNLLTASEADKIQNELIKLLQKQTQYYTGGDSSSVKIETAQSLLQSVYYTIGIYLKSFKDMNFVIDTIKEKPLSEIYLAGKNMIEIQFAKAKQLLYGIQKNCIMTDNIAYNDTIQNGLSVFFSAYDINFAAHETPASIDYPLSSDKMELTGIEYMTGYLHKLHLENTFCRHFDACELHCLLHGYDKQYKELLINIFELALTNAIGSVLADKEGSNLRLDYEDRMILRNKFTGLSKVQIKLFLKNAADVLCLDLRISDIALKKMIINMIPDLSVRIDHAIKNDCLETVFLSFKEDLSSNANRFDDGKKMADAAFKIFHEIIRESVNTAKKISLIQKNVRSIHDLIDILEGGSIFDDEYTAVFESLGDTELALLNKALPLNEMDHEIYIAENDKDWKHYLVLFLRQMDSNRRDRVTALADGINAVD